MSYSGRPALKNVNLAIESGHIVGLLNLGKNRAVTCEIPWHFITSFHISYCIRLIIQYHIQGEKARLFHMALEKIQEFLKSMENLGISNEETAVLLTESTPTGF